MLNIALFSWTTKIPYWDKLSYAVTGALLRAMKAALSAGIGILIAAATDGTLFPQGTAPYTVLIATAVLQSLDKYIRESEITKNSINNMTNTTGTVGGADINVDTTVNTDATVVDPITADVSTDVTTETPRTDN